jgi:AcrR family transcriptional regulator
MPSPLIDEHDAPAVDAQAAAPSVPRAQLTPDDWIRAATDLLVTKSIDAVRVDVLAKQLDVTRGSFYWHFTNRDDLLHQVLQDWSERTRVGPKLERQNASVQGLVRDLLALPFRGRTARRTALIEFAIRAWARRDPMAQEAVDAVDEHRIDYYVQHFQAIGFARKEAKTRAFMLYAYQLSEALLWNHGSKPDKDARRRFFEDTLLAGAPEA